MTEQCIQQRLARRVTSPETAAALFVLELLNSDQIVAVADQLLAADYDSSALRILAGKSAPIASDWLPLFTKAMAELKVQIPRRTEAASIVAREIGKMILEKEIGPRDGAQAVWDTLHSINEFAHQISVFEELAWALDTGAATKPFPELNREQIEQRIVHEAMRIATIGGDAKLGEP